MADILTEKDFGHKVTWFKPIGWFTVGIAASCFRGTRSPRRRNLIKEQYYNVAFRMASKATSHLSKLGFAKQHSYIIIADLSAHINPITGGGVGGLAYSHYFTLSIDDFLSDDAADKCIHEWAHRWMENAPKGVKQAFERLYQKLVVDPLQTAMVTWGADEKRRIIMASPLKEKWVRAYNKLSKLYTVFDGIAARIGLDCQTISQLADGEVSPEQVVERNLHHLLSVQLKTGERVPLQYLAQGYWALGRKKVKFDELLKLVSLPQNKINACFAISRGDRWVIIKDDEQFVLDLFHATLGNFLEEIGVEWKHTQLYADFSSVCLDQPYYPCSIEYIKAFGKGLAKILDDRVVNLYLEANVNVISDSLPSATGNSVREIAYQKFGIPTEYAVSNYDELWAEGITYFFSPSTGRPLKKAIVNTIMQTESKITGFGAAYKSLIETIKGFEFDSIVKSKRHEINSVVTGNKKIAFILPLLLSGGRKIQMRVGMASTYWTKEETIPARNIGHDIADALGLPVEFDFYYIG